MKPSTGSTSASANSSSSGCTTDHVMMAHLSTPTPTQFPFLTSLHHYNGDYISGGIGSHFGAIPTPLVPRNGNNTNVEFQIGGTSSSSALGNNSGGAMLSSNGVDHEQWRINNLQQFPFLSTNLEPQIGVFQFGGGENNNAEPPSYAKDNNGGRFNIRSKMDSISSVSGMMPQLNSIKLEENQSLSLQKNLLMSSSGNDVLWNNGSGNAWSEVPSFTPSPNHLL